MQYVLCVNNRRFKIEIEENDFYIFLQKAKESDFKDECINDKELLSAYIKKSSELYEKEKKIEQLLLRLEVDLSKTSV